jgi:hypothetical protein
LHYEVRIDGKQVDLQHSSRWRATDRGRLGRARFRFIEQIARQAE